VSDKKQDKGRRKAFKKIKKILDETSGDMPWAWHRITVLTNKELKKLEEKKKK